MSVRVVSTRSRWCGHGRHRVVLGAVDQRLDDRPVLAVGLLAAAAELVEERRLAGQRVPDLLDDLAEDRVLGAWATARWKSVSIATQAVVSVSCSIRSSRCGEMVQVLGGVPARRRIPPTGISTCRRTSSEVARGVVAEGRVLDRLAGDDERALAGPGDGQPHGLQGPQRLAQHGPADLQVAGTARPRREACPPTAYSPRSMASAEVREHRFHRTDAPEAVPAVWLSDRFTR